MDTGRVTFRTMDLIFCYFLSISDILLLQKSKQMFWVYKLLL
nr:MAG TPA: hypothetical protein [Caudoviricetes sp.]